MKDVNSKIINEEIIWDRIFKQNPEY